MNKVGMAVLCLLFTWAVTTGGCFSRSPAAPSSAGSTQLGVYEFEVGNSLYPKSRGASKGFQRYLSSGEEVTGSVEWKGSYAVRYKWSLYLYAPDDSIVLEWSGADLKHQFHFTPTESGTYKLEILKRDFRSRGMQLTIDPPDWNRWGR